MLILWKIRAPFLEIPLEIELFLEVEHYLGLFP